MLVSTSYRLLTECVFKNNLSFFPLSQLISLFQQETDGSYFIRFSTRNTEDGQKTHRTQCSLSRQPQPAFLLVLEFRQFVMAYKTASNEF